MAEIEEIDPVLRGGDGVGGGGIYDQKPKLPGGLQINVVNPTPALRRLENLARDLGAAPDNERVAETDLGAELFRGSRISRISKFPEQVETGFSETRMVGLGGFVKAGFASRVLENADLTATAEMRWCGILGALKSAVGMEEEKERGLLVSQWNGCHTISS